MTLQTNSIDRAIGAARFFRPRLGPEVVALRCRVVNRLFSENEGKLDELVKTLDQNVTVIDPRAGEAAFVWEMKNVNANVKQNPERAASEWLDRKIKSKEDVPLVEDFLLYPEEETPDYLNLQNTLRLRFIRAVEHWRGNTDLTLAAIIRRTFEQDA